VSVGCKDSSGLVGFDYDGLNFFTSSRLPWNVIVDYEKSMKGYEKPRKSVEKPRKSGEKSRTSCEKSRKGYEKSRKRCFVR